MVNVNVCVQSLSHVWVSATPWTIACQAPLSMKLSRQGYWGSLPFPSPGDLPNPGIEPASLASAGEFFTTEPPGKPVNGQCAPGYLHTRMCLLSGNVKEVFSNLGFWKGELRWVRPKLISLQLTGECLNIQGSTEFVSRTPLVSVYISSVKERTGDEPLKSAEMWPSLHSTGSTLKQSSLGTLGLAQRVCSSARNKQVCCRPAHSLSGEILPVHVFPWIFASVITWKTTEMDLIIVNWP